MQAIILFIPLQEATRAVAAVEKRKKEQTVAVPIVLKNKNHVSRKSVLSVKLRPGTPACNPGVAFSYPINTFAFGC